MTSTAARVEPTPDDATPRATPWPADWPGTWDGDDGKLWNREETARALGVSLPTFDRLRQNGLPHRREGGNGRPYGFYLPEVWGWREGVEAAEEEARRAREDQVAQAQLLLVGGSAEGEYKLKPQERKQLYDAELLRNKARRERGELVERPALIARDQELFRILGQFLQALPEELARDLTWSTLETAACQERVDQFQERLARLLMDRDRHGRRPH